MLTCLLMALTIMTCHVLFAEQTNLPMSLSQLEMSVTAGGQKNIPVILWPILIFTMDTIIYVWMANPSSYCTVNQVTMSTFCTWWRVNVGPYPVLLTLKAANSPVSFVQSNVEHGMTCCGKQNIKTS